MKRSFQQMILVSLFLCFVAGAPVQAIAGQNNEPQHSQGPRATSGSNPLIEEMRALDNAFRNIVSAVALGDTERVHLAVTSLRGAKEKTAEGLRDGTVVLPQNASWVKEFLDRNQKFYNKLEALDRAALHNNQREMLRISTMLMGACVKCHQTFRK